MRTTLVAAVALAFCVSPARAQSGVVLLREAYAFPASVGEDAHVFIAIENLSSMPLVILRTTSVAADSIEAIGLGARGDGGVELRSAFYVAPGRSIRMAPGRPHLVLRGINREFRVGDKIDVTLYGVEGLEIPVHVTVRATEARRELSTDS